MTFEEFAAARQLLAEETFGVTQRRAQMAELAKIEQTKAMLRRYGSNVPAQAVQPPVEPLIVEDGKMTRGRAQ